MRHHYTTQFLYSPLGDVGMTEILFKYIRRNRELFLDLVNSLSIDQLNKIPNGFNNNIVWNFGHIVITTQALSYTRSGIKPGMEIKYFDKYQKGTKPESFITEQELAELKSMLFTTIDNIEADIKNNVFTNIKPFATQTYGLEMNSIEEVITCSLTHDAMHYGVALAQRKLVV